MKIFKKLRIVIVATIAIFAFSMCGNKDDNIDVEINNQYFSTTNDIHIYKEDVVQYISEEIVDGSLIVFDGNIPNEALPKKNSHIYIPVSEKTPYGVLARVKSIQKEEKISVEIEPLSLDEAFEYLSVDETTSITPELEGVFDTEGNPIDFEIVDTTAINYNDSVVAQMHTRATKEFEFDWNWKDECLKFPVRLYKGQSGKDKIEVSGTAFVGFRNFDFDIDIANKELKYVNLNTTPYIKLGLSSKVTTGNKLEFSERIGQIRFRIIIPTPVGIPIIIPVTTYVYGTCGIKGELSATLGLQYEYNCNCVATFKNGQWTSNVTHGGFNNKSPWTVGEFDVKGEIYSGSKIGLLVGLYSATSGIGFNIEPKLSLATQAKLSSEDLLKTNPEVELSLKAGSDVYCVAGLFGKQLAKYSLEFPDFTLWSQTTYLLPNITDFTAIGSSASADISWWHDPFYFLELAGLKTGTTIYESDGTTEVDSYKPSPSSTTYEKYSYNVNATGLEAGKTYYAAPFAYWGDYMWYGEKEEFTTEASYSLAFRCSNYDYDVINFDFSLNNITENALDYTTEAQDYGGSQMRVHITAKYNASTKTLDGVFDFYFYDDPDQKRKDGFSVSLETDDSGYVSCSKVVDNGGCYAALRIYKSSDKQAAMKSYTRALIEDDCNIGIYNECYRK